MTANLQSAPFGRSGTVAYTCTLCVCHTSVVSEMVSDSSSEQDKNIISHFEVSMQILFVCLLLDSNQRPPDSESGALSAELKRLTGSKFTTHIYHMWFVHLGGFEPPRPYWAPPPQGGASASSATGAQADMVRSSWSCQPLITPYGALTSLTCVRLTRTRVWLSPYPWKV